MYEDNCFYVQRPITKVDDEGREYDAKDEVHVRFDMGRNFARAYYRDELKSKGLNPDFKLSINDDYSKRNPKYYNDESAVNTYLGFKIHLTKINQSKSLTTSGKMISNFGRLVVLIVTHVITKLMKTH